jgi:hypothetical protein
MGKESSFPWWESLTRAIDLIVVYLDGWDLLLVNGWNFLNGIGKQKTLPHQMIK